MDEHPLPTMGGSYERQEDGALLPVEGPALATAAGPIEAISDTADVPVEPEPAPAEETQE